MVSVRNEFDAFCESKFQELKHFPFKDLPEFNNKLYTFHSPKRKGILAIAIEEREN